MSKASKFGDNVLIKINHNAFNHVVTQGFRLFSFGGVISCHQYVLVVHIFGDLIKNETHYNVHKMLLHGSFCKILGFAIGHMTK